ncbi:predicted protein [Ostreococcus lucimarinus CCE9901]|uniref:Uncharacterized protein n=1 Tax=Ostreococcus lucimarinus (strain CCE9901) TaxID=436017 RepID=A4RTK1_OSTLU|nr:predicted protein [Ostreococcus lucimarinus CCE9901]ABO94353.1 predicted protein [Ostreococcus lucimarinus CCE9901]|eukprot:XP_001416061.1 predicted protein [Ostreococcus lucimarinus CCE9901]
MCATEVKRSSPPLSKERLRQSRGRFCRKSVLGWTRTFGRRNDSAAAVRCTKPREV